MNRIHWDFEIQTDHLIPVKWLDLVIVNKKWKPVLAGLCCEKELPYQQAEKLWNMKVTMTRIVIGVLEKYRKIC